MKKKNLSKRGEKKALLIWKQFYFKLKCSWKSEIPKQNVQFGVFFKATALHYLGFLLPPT